MNWALVIEKMVAECPECFEIVKNLIMVHKSYVEINELLAICLRYLFST